MFTIQCNLTVFKVNQEFFQALNRKEFFIKRRPHALLNNSIQKLKPLMASREAYCMRQINWKFQHLFFVGGTVASWYGSSSPVPLNGAPRAYFQVNKRILKWHYVYWVVFLRHLTLTVPLSTKEYKRILGIVGKPNKLRGK